MSIFERSITIRIRNALPSETLTFGSPSATDGPLPTASAAAVAAGGTLEVSAENGSGGCIGSFVPSGASARFTVSYSHPDGLEATTVTAAAAIGYVWATDAPSYAGHDVTAELVLYQGVPANKSGGYAVPLELPGNGFGRNCQDFVNSLFGPNMRSAAQIESPTATELRTATSGRRILPVASSLPLSKLGPVNGSPVPTCPAHRRTPRFASERRP